VLFSEAASAEKRETIKMLRILADLLQLMVILPIVFLGGHTLKAVLFDLDGTIIDSEWFYYKGWKAVLADYGIALDSHAWLTEFAGKTEAQGFLVLQERYGFKGDEETFFKRKKARIAKLYEEEEVALMPGVNDLITYLHEAGVRMAVVTSSLRPITEYNLTKHGLIDYFETLVTRSEVTYPKPSPEPYELCLSRLGLGQTDCIVLEDSVTGATAAKAAGLTCFGVQSHEEIRANLVVDRLFVDLHEVLEYLKGGR